MDPLGGPAIVVLTATALPAARRIAAALPGSRVHGLRNRVPGADELFEDTAECLRGLFVAGQPIVGLCAAGVLIRLLAPSLSDKRSDPPVVAVAEDGSVAVPLLGGHRGANALARTIANCFGGFAAVTTAGDLRFGVALDEPPPGYRLANPEHVKRFTAALFSKGAVRLEGKADWLRESDLPFAADARLCLRVSEGQEAGSERCLLYHPQTLALGVGCERGCDPEELAQLVATTLDEAGFSHRAIALVASLDLKADEPAVQTLAKSLNCSARFFPAAVLEAEAARLASPSETVFREVGCHGVAEGAALAAVGPEGALLVEKRKSARATCAVARSPQPIDASAVGRPRGRLSVIGIGPGDADWRTPEATKLIRAASDLVGYRFYLDLLGDLISGKTLHEFALGEEEVRAIHALRLAEEGRDVALISSGDPGIYAMAAVVFEVLQRETDKPSTAEIRIVPGISAMQAAAARIGAPLGHDFCAISLSDLLTPWETIENRVRAAGEGDFVIAFYNPVSVRRTTQLARAKRLLLASRLPQTPVLLAGNIGRPKESLRLTTLAELDAAEVDMLTLVLVGNSQTRPIARRDGGEWLLTPRGYAAKAKPERAAS